MATNQQTTPRPTRLNPQGNLSNCLSKTVNYNDAGLAAGVPFANAIPAGAVITSTLVSILTAFNGGTTNPLQVGSTALGADLVASTDSVSGTAGNKRPETATLLGVLASDTLPYVNYVPTGTAPTAGKALIVFHFIMPDA